MEVSAKRVLGKSGVEVTIMGFGGAPLGNMYQAFSDEQARATVEACYEAGIRYFDTAPYYGFGLSEHRLGEALRDKERAELVLDQGGTPAPAGRSGHARSRPVQAEPAIRPGLRLLL